MRFDKAIQQNSSAVNKTTHTRKRIKDGAFVSYSISQASKDLINHNSIQYVHCMSGFFAGISFSNHLHRLLKSLFLRTVARAPAVAAPRK